MVALFDVGGTELLLIFGAALVLLGPRRLPEIARQFGKVSAQLREANRDLKRELYSNLEPPPDPLAGGPPAPRPAARHIEQGAAALPAVAAAADYEAPYRDAEEELRRAQAAPGAAAEAGEETAPAPAADPPPSTTKADPDESASAS